MQSNDAETLDRTAGAVRGRVARVSHVATSEMENYGPGHYTDSVYRAVGDMQNRSKNMSYCTVPPRFHKK